MKLQKISFLLFWSLNQKNKNHLLCHFHERRKRIFNKLLQFRFCFLICNIQFSQVIKIFNNRKKETQQEWSDFFLISRFDCAHLLACYGGRGGVTKRSCSPWMEDLYLAESLTSNLSRTRLCLSVHPVKQWVVTRVHWTREEVSWEQDIKINPRRRLHTSGWHLPLDPQPLSHAAQVHIYRRWAAFLYCRRLMIARQHCGDPAWPPRSGSHLKSRKKRTWLVLLQWLQERKL